MNTWRLCWLWGGNCGWKLWVKICSWAIDDALVRYLFFYRYLLVFLINVHLSVFKNCHQCPLQICLIVTGIYHFSSDVHSSQCFLKTFLLETFAGIDNSSYFTPQYINNLHTQNSHRYLLRPFLEYCSANHKRSYKLSTRHILQIYTTLQPTSLTSRFLANNTNIRISRQHHWQQEKSPTSVTARFFANVTDNKTSRQSHW